MTDEEKLSLLAETIEADICDLSPETSLQELEEYDSMAKLAIIIMMEDEFQVKLTKSDFDGFETVGDILKRMS